MPEPKDQSDAVSSPGSWEAGRGNPFVGNAGGFDPDAEPAAVPIGVVDSFWESGRVRTILRGQGLLTHQAIGVGLEDWLWRDSELEAVSEPAANVLNKFPATRAASAVSDELTVGAVMFEYAFRSIRERAQVIRAQKATGPPPPEPITGVDAEGRRVTGAGAGGPVSPDDVRWETPG